MIFCHRIIYFWFGLVCFGLFWGVFFRKGACRFVLEQSEHGTLILKWYGLVKLNSYLDPVSIFMYIS